MYAQSVSKHLKFFARQYENDHTLIYPLAASLFIGGQQQQQLQNNSSFPNYMPGHQQQPPAPGGAGNASISGINQNMRNLQMKDRPINLMTVCSSLCFLLIKLVFFCIPYLPLCFDIYVWSLTFGAEFSKYSFQDQILKCFYEGKAVMC